MCRAYASALSMDKRRWLVDHIRRCLPHSSGEEPPKLSLSGLRRLVAAYQVHACPLKLDVLLDII